MSRAIEIMLVPSQYREITIAAALYRAELRREAKRLLGRRREGCA